MEIEEFKKEKRELESAIATNVQELINIFEERTGYTPNDIIISIVHSQDITCKNKNFIDYAYVAVEI